MTDKNWQDEELWIVTASSSDNGVKSGAKGGGFPSSDPKKDEETKDSRMKAGTLAKQMSHFVGVISGVFTDVQKQITTEGELQLDEITLTVEISGEGEVKLFGTGGKAGSKGAIE
ncbi:hypothetical protein A0J48_009600 [Sphaerospermopsis aphanizomenoides BCCUSP55]|uniref:Pepco domain-containing protein n=1 Tax=Sphaerospermopsis aphanizomenoides TaxID=459663 RepID=UPI000AF082FE|nr:hypothetical protein [Sphaerospermopsis aphanizomenoides]MBK1987788.1 hypothetical protein [Sphaerospermopsis aphanizomenoides BCCUSP55]